MVCYRSLYFFLTLESHKFPYFPEIDEPIALATSEGPVELTNHGREKQKQITGTTIRTRSRTKIDRNNESKACVENIVQVMKTPTKGVDASKRRRGMCKL